MKNIALTILLLFVVGSVFAKNNIKYYQHGTQQVNPRQHWDKVVAITNPGNSRYQVNIENFSYHWWHGNNVNLDLEAGATAIVYNVSPGDYNVIVNKVFEVGPPLSDFQKVCKSLGSDPYKTNIGINIPRITTKKQCEKEVVDMIINIDDEFKKYKQ